MASQLALRCFLVQFVALFCCLVLVDAAGFTSPNVDADKFVNLDTDATFEFDYTVEDKNNQQVINCAYRGITTRSIINKNGLAGAIVASAFTQRVSVTVDSANRIGFKLSKAQLSDAGAVGCTLVYNGVFYYSKVYHLKIYEPPRFIDCLGPVGQAITLNEGQSVNSTCIYYGNPRPALTCRVLDVNNAQVSPPFPITVSQNLTMTNRLLLSNVGKNAKFVSCTASHTATGSKETKRSLTVYYLPTAPLELRRLRSTSTSITVAWKAPAENGNRPINTYYLEIQNTGTFSRNGTNITTVGAFPKLEYTFNYLQPNVLYRVYVSAYNLVGKGVAAEQSYKAEYVAPDSGESSGSGTNTGAIVGGVIGGIAFIVIVVLIVVYIVKKRDSPGKPKYPSSFVEEAVDYPASNQKIYSKINKKKIPTSIEEDSTSGYPDIIHQAKPRSQPEKAALNSDSRDDHSISPSYESSRKEYV